MSFNLDFTNSNYAGVDTGYISKPTISDMFLVQQFGADVRPGIKGKYNIYRGSVSGSIGAMTTCPTNYLTTTLDQQSNDICRFRADFKIANDVLLGTLREIDMSVGIQNENLDNSPELFAAVMSIYQEEFEKQLEETLITGDDSYAIVDKEYLQVCNGLLTQFDADPDVVTVDSSVVTSSNVKDELQKIINALNPAIRYSNRDGKVPKFAVSFNIANALQENYANTSNGNDSIMSSEAGPLRYQSYEVVPLRYLPDDTAFMTYSDNIIVAYDDRLEYESMVVTNQLYISHCHETWGTILTGMSPFYGRAEDIVYYRAAV